MLLNFGVKSVWILLNNKVQDRIGHEAYGTYIALFSLGFLFLALADLGVNQYVTKTLASAPGKLREVMPGYFRIKLVLAFIYPVFMTGVGAILGYNSSDLWFLLIISFTHSFAQLFSFFRSGFQAFQLFRLDAFASILDRLILIGIVSFLLSRNISLDSYVFACFISASLTMVLLYVLLVKQIGMILPKRGEKSWREMLKLSMPFAILTVLYSINDKVDQVMLERIYSRHEASLYGAAYRWVDALMMYLWTVLPIFFARFAYHINSSADQKKLLRFGQPLAALPMIFVGVFVMFYGEKLLWQYKASTPAEIAVMTTCLKILFIAVMVNGIFAIFSTLLTSTNHEKFVGWAIAGSITLNIVLNILLIPHYGAIASAWNTVTSFSLLSLSYVIYLVLRGDVGVPWDILGKIFLAGGIYAATFWGLYQTTLDWYWVTLAAGIVLAISSLMLKLIPLGKTANE